MASRIHYLIDDGEETACKFLYEDDEQVSDDIDDVTCKKCIKLAQAMPVHYLLDDDNSVCGLEYNGAQHNFVESREDATCAECLAYADEKEEEEESIEEEPAPVAMHLKAIFTLAPRALDKGDTREVPCAWVYQGASSEATPTKVRKVLVPEIQMQSQINVYLHPTPYITFQEQTLEKYIKQGKVIAANENGVAYDPIKASIALSNNNTQEEKLMAKKPIVKVAVATKPTAIITEIAHANMPTPQIAPLAGVTPLGIAPQASALDAILARPIAHIMTQAPVGVPEELLPVVTPKKAIALPRERSEEELVQGLKPHMPAYSLAHDPLYVQLAQLVVGLQNKVESLEERLFLAEQVERVPAPALTMHDILSNVWDGILGSVAIEEQAPVVPDAWGDMLGEVQAPAKVKSTLKVFTGEQASTTTVKAPERTSTGKTDPQVVKAIQAAWKSGKVTQSSLAQKYGMDEKKVWYFCNRARQLV